MKRLLAVIGFSLLFFSCRRDTVVEPPAFSQATQVVLKWNQLLLDLERFTPGYRPTVSSRMFAYVGLTAYEAALPALVEDHVSVSNFCPGYVAPPLPTAGDFDLPASLNAAYAQIARHFFPTAPPALQADIARLEMDLARRFLNDQAPAKEGFSRSIAFGRSVADAVWQWSRTDTLGHDGYLYNFDRSYVPPSCPGCWQPVGEHAMPALTPLWGHVRPFLVGPNDIKVNAPAPFDEAPGSAFYTEAMEVFSVSQPLTKENRWIAEFWSDDLPGLTMSPAGRWVSIANQAVVQAQPGFPEVIELYLRLGWGLHDAAVVCWAGKYQYNTERPESYINRSIHPGWKPLHDSPSFPSYPSGHSAFGAAAAEILGASLGYEFTITDRTHEDRKEFSGAPRHFNSFAEMARENALSRVALGVHYRMDCEEGLRIGRLIGQRISQMELQRNSARR